MTSAGRGISPVGFAHVSRGHSGHPNAQLVVCGGARISVEQVTRVCATCADGGYR